MLSFRICIASCLIFTSGLVQAQSPSFKKGVNLTSWFQDENIQHVQFTKFTKKDFQNIKSLGCDVIRLPINLHFMTSDDPNYTIDPLLLSFLDSAVAWAQAVHLSLILDNHSDQPTSGTDPKIGPVLTKVWTQMATHYKNSGDSIFYEILNEPHGLADSTWGRIQQNVINAIRVVDTKHFIVVGAANWNSYQDLVYIPVYTDTKLIYTFHFYDPFIFTHQGANWPVPPLTSVKGVPFPYRSADMPAEPVALKGTFIDGDFAAYSTQGTVSYVQSLIDIAAAFKTSKHVPIFCGELGAYNLNSKPADRVAWYQAVRTHLESLGIPWTTWDYKGAFGLFNKGSDEQFNYDLNLPLVQALGLTPPAQQVYSQQPKTSSFVIYDDFIGAGIVDTSNPGNGTLDYYSSSAPEAGKYSIYWTGVDQYTTIAFDFVPNVDLSLLQSHGHELRFWVKGDSPSAKFDVRFIDTKTGPNDHPWRMGKTIDNTIAPFDGKWHEVVLPLSQLEDKGSYDSIYYNPAGKFDWTAVDVFQIDAEYELLTNINFWFDEIRDVGDDVPYTNPVTGVTTKSDGLNLSVYPNPMQKLVMIQFSLPGDEHVNLTLFNLTGQFIKTISNETLGAGQNTINWNSQELTPGMYVLQFQTKEVVTFRRVVKIN